MEPVADTDLRHYLANATGSKKERSTLCKMFGCLSSAVAYLHLNKCRHKDLKPHNILIKDEKVYVADFGLALDYTMTNRETTMGRPEAFTELYVAPEVSIMQTTIKLLLI
jgi:serine/threonine protein kinase